MALLGIGQTGSAQDAFADAIVKRAAVAAQMSDARNNGSADAADRSDGLSATGAATYATTQMVNFSITYPGGIVITSSMSRAQFQDALASNDPRAFGAVSDADGTTNGRDAVLAALGLESTGTAASPTMPVQVSTKTAAKTTATEFGASGAEIAEAVLRSAGSGSAAEDHASETGTRQTVSTTTTSLRGTANGVTAAIAFSTVSAASVSTSTSDDAAADGIDVVA